MGTAYKKEFTASINNKRENVVIPDLIRALKTFGEKVDD